MLLNHRKNRKRYYKKRAPLGRKRKLFARRPLLLSLIIIFGFFSIKKPLFNLFSEKEPKISESMTYAIPIFMYHYVESVVDEGDILRKDLNISPEDLESQLHYLKQNSYSALSFSDFVKILESGNPPPKRAFVLTFDDGYESFYTNAFPILKKYNFKAVNFIILNTLDYQGHLKTWQIKEMGNSGLVEIGAHSVSHADLTAVGEEKLEKEIGDSKNILQNELGMPVKYFSYPAGKYDERVIEELKRAGYEAAVAIEGEYPHTRGNIYRLSRIRANLLKPGGLEGFFY